MNGNKDIVVGIRLTADGKDLVGEVKLSKREMDQFGTSVDRADKKTSQLAKTSAIAARHVALMTAAAAAAAGAFAIKKSIDFGRAVSELSAITGATGDQLGYLTRQSKEMGLAVGVMAGDTVEAFQLVASAKPDLLENAEALAAVTRETIILSKASGMSLPDAADAAAGSLNQFSASADQTNRFVNVLAAGAKYGSSMINQTTQALKMSGTVAAQANMSYEETNAVIQAMAKMMIKGSEAGTGLRSVILRLSTQTRDEFNPEIVGFTQAIKNLADAKLSTTEKEKLFGQEAITAANALIIQANSLEGLTDKLTGTNTAYEQAATRIDNLGGDIDILTAYIDTLAITLGETSTGPMRSFTQELIELTSRINLAFKLMDEKTPEGLAHRYDQVGDRLEFIRKRLKKLDSDLIPDLLQRGTIRDLKEEYKALQVEMESLQKKMVHEKPYSPKNNDGAKAYDGKKTPPHAGLPDELVKDAVALTEQMDAAFLDISERTTQRYTEMWTKLAAKGGEGNQELQTLETSYSSWLDQHWSEQEAKAAAKDEQEAAREAERTDNIINQQQDQFDRLSEMTNLADASEEERALLKLEFDLERMQQEFDNLKISEEQKDELRASFEQARIDRAQITAVELDRIENDRVEKSVALERKRNSLVGSMQARAYSQGVGLLQLFAGKSKAVSLLLIALQTAQSVREIAISAATTSAQIIAFGELEAAKMDAILPGSGMAARAKAASSVAAVNTAAAIGAGLAIAGGVVQGVAAAQGGGESAQPTYNVNPGTGLPSQQQPGATQQPQQKQDINVYVMVSGATTLEEIKQQAAAQAIDTLGDEITNNHRIVIHPNSANAQLIRENA